MKCFVYLLSFPTAPSLSQEQNFSKIGTKHSFVVVTSGVLRAIWFHPQCIALNAQVIHPLRDFVCFGIKYVIHFLFFSIIYPFFALGVGHI